MMINQKSELFVRGYEWCKKELESGKTIEELEIYIDCEFDYNDFNRCANQAIREEVI